MCHLWNLTSLNSLNVSGCQQLSDVSPVSKLTLLTILDLSLCVELDDVRFVSSLVRLRTLDLSDCSEQLVDVLPLSSLTSLRALYLGCSDDEDHQPACRRVASIVSRGVGNIALGWM